MFAASSHTVWGRLCERKTWESLTALAVTAATKPGRYGDGDGLALLVKPTGGRFWVLRVMKDGKRRDFGLGSAQSVTLADARLKSAALRKQAKDGVDVLAARREARVALEERSARTFRATAGAMHAGIAPTFRNAKHSAQWLSTLRTYAFRVRRQAGGRGHRADGVASARADMAPRA